MDTSPAVSRAMNNTRRACFNKSEGHRKLPSQRKNAFCHNIHRALSARYIRDMDMVLNMSTPQ